MNRLLTAVVFFTFVQNANANAKDRCDGLFEDADKIVAEVLKSPTALDAFAKGNRFVGVDRKISIKSEPVLDANDVYFATRYIVSIAGAKPQLKLYEDADETPEFRLATLKFVSKEFKGSCLFNPSPQYSESKISKEEFDKIN